MIKAKIKWEQNDKAFAVFDTYTPKITINKNAQQITKAERRELSELDWLNEI